MQLLWCGPVAAAWLLVCDMSGRAALQSICLCAVLVEPGVRCVSCPPGAAPWLICLFSLSVYAPRVVLPLAQAASAAGEDADPSHLALGLSLLRSSPYIMGDPCGPQECVGAMVEAALAAILHCSASQVRARGVLGPCVHPCVCTRVCVSVCTRVCKSVYARVSECA
jgi:hypothetical protein